MIDKITHFFLCLLPLCISSVYEFFHVSCPFFSWVAGLFLIDWLEPLWGLRRLSYCLNIWTVSLLEASSLHWTKLTFSILLLEYVWPERAFKYYFLNVLKTAKAAAFWELEPSGAVSLWVRKGP